MNNHRSEPVGHPLSAEILRVTASGRKLTAEEERELARRAQRGDGHAVERLVEANLLIVKRAAERYAGRNGKRLDDLFQEGYRGLQAAIHNFDPDRGKRLAEFAQYHIHGRIKRALGKEIRREQFAATPEEGREEAETDAEDHLAALWEHGEDPSEAAQQEDSAADFDTRRGAWREESIRAAEFDLNGGLYRGEVVPLPSPADLAERANVARIIAAVLDALLPGERELLRLRYGFGALLWEDVDGVPEPEAAHRLGIRRATLDKSEQAALAKARNVLAGMGYGPQLLAAFDGKRRRKQ